MILVCGIPTESPVERVIDALDDAGLPFAVLNQRQFDDIEIDVEVIEDGSVAGTIRIGRQRWPVVELTGVYVRVMDAGMLPELAGEPPESPRREHCGRFHEALITFCDVTPARVLNRTAPMLSNASKPYQAQVIASHGFSVPETLVTNEPEEVHAFVAMHERVIYKSMSGVRSIVEVLDDTALGRLDAIRWCPVQFQALVPGTDIRVHVVGEELFATEIRSDATDYRYATQQVDMPASLAATDLDDDTSRRCLALAEDLGLPLAGIDLKRTDDGETFCFEVNPSPAFTYFESHTGQPIAAAIARYLAG